MCQWKRALIIVACIATVVLETVAAQAQTFGIETHNNLMPHPAVWRA